MEILWLAIFLYSIGLAVVLHFKPALMFHPTTGAWKEFGYQRGSRYTIFPFWLFAIVWALMSYVLAATITWMLPVLGVFSTFSSEEGEGEGENGDWNDGDWNDGDWNDGDWNGNGDGDGNGDGTYEEPEMEPVKRGPGRPRKNANTNANTPLSPPKVKAKPGYYVLDPATNTNAGGLHKYIYYGSSPPPDVDLNQVYEENADSV